MKSTRMLTILVLALGLMVCPAKASEAEQMGTAWTYQGRLIDANKPADGEYNFQFKLFDDPWTGSLIAGPVYEPSLNVIDGYFTVELDFGSDVFDGNAVWLETTVAHGDGSDPCMLRPRQEITPTPYALQTRGIFVDVRYIDYPNTWTAKESNRNWWSVAMSADGTKQTVVVFGEQIYVSTDSGNTWTAKESNRQWLSVAMSADGTKQTAVVNMGQIYVSADSGNTWTAKESDRYWRSVAMSADGTKQTAVVYYGQIYVSTDSGNTWTAKESNRRWWSVAMSADGTKQTAVVLSREIYVSTDSGNTWTAKESNRGWWSVAMSADGIKQTAVAYNGQIYVCSADVGFDYKVGIGTTNPQGELDVNGSIYQRGSLLHADYVFEPDYELESIDKHSEFMWQHKHLAAIPKAKVDENGQEIIEVGAHRKGIVEELEKAHIYIEQLHNRIKMMEEKMAKLEAVVCTVQ